MTTHTCPNCRYRWSDDGDDEMARAVDEDASAYRADVLPLREPVDPENEVLRAQIGPK